METPDSEVTNQNSGVRPVPGRPLQELLEPVPLLDWNQWDFMTSSERRLHTYNQLRQLTLTVNELVEREESAAAAKADGGRVMGCQLTDNEPTPGPKRPLHPDVMIERRRVLHILDRAIQAAAEGEPVTIAMLIEVKNRIED